MAFSPLRLALLTVLLLPATAWAHGGHGVDAGLLHPLTGIDHWLAALAVGLWAGAGRGPHPAFAPLAFVVVMLATATIAVGAGIPVAETGLVLSLLVLGGLLLAGRQVSSLAGILLVAAAAAFHGWAHGAEMPAGTGTGVYLAGLGVTTLGLHLGGIGLARLLSAERARWTGLPVMGTGLLLLLG